MKSFGNKKLGFGGYHPTLRKSMATRLSEIMPDAPSTNGLVSGGDWATGISGALKGFMAGYGAARDARNEREYDQYLQDQYEKQLSKEQENADRDFNLKAYAAGIDPNKMGQEGYLQELQQQKLDQANALKQAQYDREDAVAKQAHDYKMAQIAAQNEYKKYELEGKKAAEEAEKKAKAEKEEEAKKEAISAAENALADLQDLADSNVLTSFGYKRASMSPWGGSEEHKKAKGRLSADIAAIGPLVLKKVKEAGASGINTVGEAMLYIGLTENPTSAELAGALPILTKTLGIEIPQSNVAQQTANGYTIVEVK